MISPCLQVGWFYVTIHQGKCKIIFRWLCIIFGMGGFFKRPYGMWGCSSGFSSFPWLKPIGYGRVVPPGRFFLPPLFQRKRGGQGVSLRHYSTATDAKYAMYFSFFSWRSPRPPRFQGKSVKLNFDDPVNSCPIYLGLLIYKTRPWLSGMCIFLVWRPFRAGHGAGCSLTWGFAPGYLCASASRSLFCSVFRQFSF